MPGPSQDRQRAPRRQEQREDARDTQRGFLVPTDTHEVLKTYTGEQNLFLMFHKFVDGWEKKKEKGSHSEEDGTRELGTRKKAFLERIVGMPRPNSDEILQQMNSRHSRLIASYETYGYSVRSIESLSTHWRLAVGLGAKGALEIGLTLHHLYGFPYIPASSLKGLARAYALMEEGKAACEEDRRFNENAVIDNMAKGVFGDQEGAGEVLFFDGLPEQFPKLEVDIINVHYQHYYSDTGGTVPPGDWMSPVPTNFLTVAAGERFMFAVASRNAALASKAAEWLIGGLTQLGVGGKTSSGYGFFKAKTQPGGVPRVGETSAPARKPLPAGAEEAIVAEVTEKQLHVRLQGGEVLPCTGVSNPANPAMGLMQGAVLYVTVTRDKKTKKITGVRFNGKP